MIAYPDTSFLCSLYRDQEFSPRAFAYYSGMTEVLHATSLLEFEFLQAIELQVFLFSQDRKRGYSRREAGEMIQDWRRDVAEGKVKLVPCDTDHVIRYALELSRSHTAGGGHRSLDLLHVATAVHLGAKEFLSFDDRQVKLARKLGLATPLV
jgi:predicted nucleic acid-binding protein